MNNFFSNPRIVKFILFVGITFLFLHPGWFSGLPHTLSSQLESERVSIILGYLQENYPQGYYHAYFEFYNRYIVLFPILLPINKGVGIR